MTMNRLKSCVAGICHALLEPVEPASSSKNDSRQLSPLPQQPEAEILCTELPQDWWTPPTVSPKKEAARHDAPGAKPKKLMKLVPSMPAFLDHLEPEQPGESNSSLKRIRCDSCANMEEQRVELKLTDSEEAHFEGMSKEARGAVDVVFEGVSPDLAAEFVLQEASNFEQTYWSIPFSNTKLPPGLYKFYFRVGGARVLSRVYPVIGDLNVAIFHEALRRYIVAVGRELGSKQEELLVRMTSFDMKAPKAPKDGLRHVPRAGSYSQGLNNLEQENQDHSNKPPKTKDKRSRSRSFSDNVFVGLYDNELSLRLQPAWHTVWATAAQASGRAGQAQAMQLWAGSARMGKQRGQCEDACFVSTSAIGVADGVGGMSAFTSYGVNSAKLAWELMEGARSACHSIELEQPSITPQERSLLALQRTEENAKSFGASTICVASVKGNELGVSNLGDSGFMILRRGKHRLEIAKHSKEQHHRWNCPYQLTRLPPALASQFPDFACDTPNDADLYNDPIHEGDLVLLYTDGMRDNLHDHEICQIAECALAPGISQLVGLPSYKTAPEDIAKALAVAAFERSCDRKAKVPFAESCRQHGYDYEGGKEDDITVVAAWVLQDKSDGASLSANSNDISIDLSRPRTTTT